MPEETTAIKPFDVSLDLLAKARRGQDHILELKEKKKDVEEEMAPTAEELTAIAEAWFDISKKKDSTILEVPGGKFFVAQGGTVLTKPKNSLIEESIASAAVLGPALASAWWMGAYFLVIDWAAGLLAGGAAGAMTMVLCAFIVVGFESMIARVKARRNYKNGDYRELTPRERRTAATSMLEGIEKHTRGVEKEAQKLAAEIEELKSSGEDRGWLERLQKAGESRDVDSEDAYRDVPDVLKKVARELDTNTKALR